MKKIIFFLYSIICLTSLQAQNNGDIDPTFVTGGSFAISGTVKAIAVQPDGKKIVGGTFQKYNDIAANNIVRLNVDGSIDSSFLSGEGFNSIVRTIVIQTDGKILVGGSFNSYNGFPARTIVRLNTDGSIDNTFNSNNTISGNINSIKLLADGKILIGGGISRFNGSPVNKIIRLNNDGTIDLSFNAANHVSRIESIEIQSDGKILIGGVFLSGSNQKSIFRLNENGTLDTTFNANTFLSWIKSIIVLESGKILIASSVAGEIQCLNADGSIDQSFMPILFRQIESMKLQTDGKIVACSKTYNIDSTVHKVIRFNEDGSMDPTFNSTVIFNNNLLEIALQPDGKILVGGDFSKHNNNAADSMVRLNADGTIDSSFEAATVLNESTTLMGVALQEDGKIIVGGGFNYYNGSAVKSILRFNNDGTVDNSFNSGTGFLNFGNLADSAIHDLIVQPDGKIIATGRFSEYNGTNINSIVRLLPDGSLDPSFSSPLTMSQRNLNRVLLLPDGKILIAGGMANSAEPTVKTLTRLHPDGSVDHTFNDLGFDYEIMDIAVQPDGKILAGGNFQTYDNNPVNAIIRLNPDGTRDNSFTPPAFDASSFVETILLKPDGKIILGGYFSINGDGYEGIAGLVSNGSLDPDFANNIPLDGIVLTSLLQSNGSMFIGGTFNSYAAAETPSKWIVKLDNQGNVDPSFHGETGTSSGYIYDIKAQADGKIIAVGNFQQYNGQQIKQIVRLKNDAALDTKSSIQNDFIMYPNPVKEKLFLVLNEVLTGYEIFDFSGRKILVGNTKTIDVSAFPKGVYLIKANTETATSTQKFIKE